MLTYSRSKQEYIDRYDRATMNDCRWRENFHKNYRPPGDKTEKDLSLVKMVSEVALYYDLFFATLSWWEDKTKTIEEWARDDARKDRLLETAKAPEGVRCLKCWVPLVVKDKSLHDWDSNGERVLFFYDCPTGCLPHRAFFEGGEEYKIKRDVCPKCKTELIRTRERVEEKKIVMTDTCPQCGHIATDELDLSLHKEEPDPDFEKDRARFCLTDEAGRKALEERYRMDQMKKMVDEWKEKEKHKEDYDAVANIKKLNVLDLEKLLTPTLEEAGYLRLQLGTPEIGKDFFLPFTAYDSKSDRADRASTYELTKLIKKCLAETNWRLMTDGINYRLGFLTGRLRAYEREEDLLRLVRQKES